MKKGFTLIEMLAVIIILSVLLTLSFTPLSRIIKVGNKKITTAQDVVIRDALKDFSKDNNSKNKVAYYNCTTLKDLVDEGYIEKKLLNGVNLNQSISFIIKDDKLTYEFNSDKCEDADFEYSFELIGKDEETVEMGNTYSDKGFKALIYGYDVSDDVDIKYFDQNHNEIDAINTNVNAIYFIEYKLAIDEDNEKYDTLERMIKVVNNDKPRITHPGDTSIEKTVETFNILEGVKAIDKNNKELNVIAKTNLSLGIPGVYSITYTATDDFGNTMSLNRKITINKIKLYKETILNGADPVLDDGMIPVVIDNSGNVKKADLSNEWYKYDDNDNTLNNSKWANAVLVTNESRTGYKNVSANTTIKPEDIRAYLVWIPRYKYAIPTVSDKNNPPLINIQFESKNATKSTGDATGTNYLTHPAFTFNNNNLSGIWIGKFETTVDKNSTCGACPYGNDCTNECLNIDSKDLTILPNVSSLRFQTISNQYKTAQKLKDYGMSGDTHMIKNTEWGAVAYLSHSKYGSNTEIRINNNSLFTTGCGASSDNAGATGECSIKYGSSSIYPQSTTDNITGIFDMSGGAWEYTMGNYKSTLGNSGFTEMPNPIYVDIYNTNYYENACNSGICKGHANYETSGWYGDYYYPVDPTYIWVQRSGDFSTTTSAGIFFTNGVSGINSGYGSFRISSVNIE